MVLDVSHLWVLFADRWISVAGDRCIILRHYLLVTLQRLHLLTDRLSLSNRAASTPHWQKHTLLYIFSLRQHPSLSWCTPASPRATACSAAPSSQAVALAEIQSQLWPQLTERCWCESEKAVTERGRGREEGGIKIRRRDRRMRCISALQ